MTGQAFLSLLHVHRQCLALPLISIKRVCGSQFGLCAERGLDGTEDFLSLLHVHMQGLALPLISIKRVCGLQCGLCV